MDGATEVRNGVRKIFLRSAEVGAPQEVLVRGRLQFDGAREIIVRQLKPAFLDETAGVDSCFGGTVAFRPQVVQSPISRIEFNPAREICDGR